MPKGQRQLTGGENNPRFARFTELYLTTGNARHSAIMAGFSESYSDAFAYKLAQRARISMAPALRAAGIDEVRIAHLIEGKLDAKMVKWNPEKKEFQEFVDHGTQLKAAELAMEALNALPRGKEDGNGGAGGTRITIVINCPRPVRTPPTIEAKT